MSFLAYFRSPFPSQKGFSAYRTPGLAVHGPLIFASLAGGFFLCWPHPVLRPLVIVWVLAGIYLGRDITIFCHYNPLLTLLSWAAFVFVLLKAQMIAKYGATHVVVPAIISAVLGVLLFAVAFVFSRVAPSGEQERE